MSRDFRAIFRPNPLFHGPLLSGENAFAKFIILQSSKFACPYSECLRGHAVLVLGSNSQFSIVKIISIGFAITSKNFILFLTVESIETYRRYPRQHCRVHALSLTVRISSLCSCGAYRKSFYIKKSSKISSHCPFINDPLPVLFQV